MKKYRILILVLLVGVGLCNSIINLARLAIGCPVGEIVYSGPYIKYFLFLIPLLFVLKVCISVLKTIYIKGSIVSGVITGVLMILYAGNNGGSVLVALYFVCMVILSFGATIHLMFKIRPEADEEMGLLAGLMRGLTYKKKLKVALLLLGVCIVCAVYIIFPKKWACIYVDSNEFMNHAYEMNNDVLAVGEEVVIMDDLFVSYMDYKVGWKFYASKSGNTKVSLLSEIVYEENDDWERETRDIYVDDNLYVHYDTDYEYYLNVYGVFFFVIVNSMALCIIFLVSSFIDMRKAKQINQINQINQVT